MLCQDVYLCGNAYRFQARTPIQLSNWTSDRITHVNVVDTGQAGRANDARQSCHKVWHLKVSGGSKSLPHFVMLQHIPLSVPTLFQLASFNAQMIGDRSATGCSHLPTKFWGKAARAQFLRKHRIWICARTLERERAIAIKMGFIPGFFHCSPRYCPLGRSPQLTPSWFKSLERQVLGNLTNFNGKKWLKRLGNICFFLDTLWTVKVPNLNLPCE